MDIVILGVGSTGRFVANFFSKEKHSVTVIDANPETLMEFSKKADIATVCSHGLSVDILSRSKKNDNSIFIALTSNDGQNITSAQLAKSLGYKQVIARVRDPSYLDQKDFDYQKLFNIDHFICPNEIMALDVIKHLLVPKALYVENFSGGTLELQVHTIEKGWKYCDTYLKDWEFNQQYLIPVICRESEKDVWTTIFPRGDTQFLEGDQVSFLGLKEDIEKLPQLMNIETSSIQSVVVCGASSFDHSLGDKLHNRNIDIKIIESDLAICEALAREYPFATVLHHNEIDRDFLLEENLKGSDGIICCSKTTEKNLLSATIAQDLGCENVVTMVEDDSFSYLLDKLGISYTISEKLQVANHIFGLLYGELMTLITSIYGNKTKVLEVEIREGSKLANIEVSKLSTLLPKECTLGFLQSDDHVFLAKGNSEIHIGDKLVIFIAPQQIETFQKLL